jgi:hypothetical protein
MNAARHHGKPGRDHGVARRPGPVSHGGPNDAATLTLRRLSDSASKMRPPAPAEAVIPSHSRTDPLSGSRCGGPIVRHPIAHARDRQARRAHTHGCALSPTGLRSASPVYTNGCSIDSVIYAPVSANPDTDTEHAEANKARRADRLRTRCLPIDIRDRNQMSAKRRPRDGKRAARTHRDTNREFARLDPLTRTGGALGGCSGGRLG